MATPMVETTTHAAPKRSRSPESIRSSSSTPVPAVTNGKTPSDTIPLPRFLSQSPVDIHARFDELQARQTFRLQLGNRTNDGSSQYSPDPSTKDVKSRNRYLDIYPWAASRIRLKVPEGHCDYINASPISLCCSKSGREYRYIAAQGPKARCVDDFWQMIWHETSDTAVIIMLTSLIEGIKEKCFQYYPDDLESDTMDLHFQREEEESPEAQAKVIEKTWDDETKATIRHIELTHNSQTKTIWHLSFPNWPDHAIPDLDTRTALLKLVALSREKNPDIANPNIVHCSAGCGRTGTFIALEHLLGELHNGSFAEIQDRRDPVFEAVNRLREQRMVMVQTADQLAFLYTVLKNEYIKVQQERQRALEAERAAEAAAAAAAGLLPTPPPSTEAKKVLSRSGEPLFKSMKLSRNLKKLPSFLRRTHSERAAVGEAGGSVPSTPATPATPRTPTGSVAEKAAQESHDDQGEVKEEGRIASESSREGADGLPGS